MSELEGVAMGVIAAGGFFVLFAFLTAAIAAILFGPQRGPTFIRRAAYLYSRPRTIVEWIGFTLATLIALGTQWAALDATRTYSDAFGPIGVALLQLEVLVALLWIGYLLYLYRVRRSAR